MYDEFLDGSFLFRYNVPEITLPKVTESFVNTCDSKSSYMNEASKLSRQTL